MRTMGMMLAAAAGAALMYLLDPDRGNARRTSLRDRALHIARSRWRWTRNSAFDVANHTRGLIAEFRGKMWTMRPSDEVLVERVRSEMGHVIRNPHRVVVTADAGWVELRGDVLPFEKDALIAAINGIPGVFGVQDHLQEHGWINARVAASDRR